MTFLTWMASAPFVYQALLASGVVALVLIVLQFIGLDLMPEMPEDAGVFTLRNAMAFMLGLSVAAILARYAGRSDLYALGLGVLAGFMFLALNMSLLMAFSQLSEDGTVRLDSLVGTMGQVTVPVREGQNSRGKASFTSADGRQFELAVYSGTGLALERGTRVRLQGLEAGELGAVEPWETPPETAPA